MLPGVFVSPRVTVAIEVRVPCLVIRRLLILARIDVVCVGDVADLSYPLRISPSCRSAEDRPRWVGQVQRIVPNVRVAVPALRVVVHMQNAAYIVGVWTHEPAHGGGVVAGTKVIQAGF